MPPKVGMSFWSRQATSALIEVYRANQSLYDVKSPDYFNRMKNRDALEEMVKAVKKFDADVTDDDCRKKYQSLRAQFSREHAKQEASKRSGASTDEIYISKWWCYGDLLFLRDSVRHKKGIYVGCEPPQKLSKLTEQCGSESEVEEEDMVLEYLEEDEAELAHYSRPSTSHEETQPEEERPVLHSPSPQPGPSGMCTPKISAPGTRKRSAPPKERSRPGVKEDDVDQLTSGLLNYFSSRRQRDKFDSFGEFVASRLRHLKKKVSRKAEHKIMLLLMQYENAAGDSEDSE